MTNPQPFMFGRKEITCPYCKRTLPKKYCKRHIGISSITERRYSIVQPVEDGELSKQIDKILMEAEGKYFSSEYDDQATEAIRWPARDQILQLFSAQQAKHQEELKQAHIGELNDLKKSFRNRADKSYTGQQVHAVIEARISGSACSLPNCTDATAYHWHIGRRCKHGNWPRFLCEECSSPTANTNTQLTEPTQSKEEE